ncbi:MAG: translesion error-prone DNA polymerase V autoproteolytic subunit [Bacteroidota bacterium]|jgi:DNA polymerase V|nr:translesion error-prone DNA polymerase V autoproteolytic subunit [Bacteroidota bacterium]
MSLFTDKIAVHPILVSEAVALPIIRDTAVKAGFPSPALDYMQDAIDLNQLLIKHPSSTFLVNIEGDSMVDAFIANPALLIIDRALQVRNGDIVLAVVNGDFTVKRYVRKADRIFLVPENKQNSMYQPIEIVDGMEFSVWGVVAHIISSPRKR